LGPALSPGAVAARLGVCRETVYRLISRGELPALRIGSLLRITEHELALFLARQRCQ
jgi:excisionase family DNA binding protein